MVVPVAAFCHSVPVSGAPVFCMLIVALLDTTMVPRFWNREPDARMPSVAVEFVFWMTPLGPFVKLAPVPGGPPKTPVLYVSIVPRFTMVREDSTVPELTIMRPLMVLLNGASDGSVNVIVPVPECDAWNVPALTNAPPAIVPALKIYVPAL